MTLSLVAISGSLRQDSYNTKLITELAGLAQDRARIQRLSIEEVPLYNADIADEPWRAVEGLKQAIEQADGVIIATPEYNYGIPGVLKNALDWLSRPAYRSVFARKPVAILGASMGPVGTARAQGQLKQVLLGMVSEVFPFPEVTVGKVAGKFDQNGQLEDQRTKELLQRFLGSFCDALDERA